MVTDLLAQVACDEDQDKEGSDGEAVKVDGSSQRIAEEEVQYPSGRWVAALRSGYLDLLINARVCERVEQLPVPAPIVEVGDDAPPYPSHARWADFRAGGRPGRSRARREIPGRCRRPTGLSAGDSSPRSAPIRGGRRLGMTGKRPTPYSPCAAVSRAAGR
jgi:hypothetical protein